MKTLKNYSLEFMLVIIQIILVILKINKIITCKWVYILMPTWILLALILLVIIFAIYVDKYFKYNGMR